MDKDDLNVPMADGERGAVVYTHLWRTSQPMIRFAPGDESYLTHEACPCGRTYPRLPEGVLGRLDDMLVVRGANIFPSAIETGLRSVAGFGAEFTIHIFKQGALDEIVVRAECDPAVASDPAAREHARVAGESRLKSLTGIRVPIEILETGTLPETVFKARRVLDERPRA